MTYSAPSVVSYLSRVVRLRAAIRAADRSAVVYPYLSATRYSSSLAYANSGAVTSTEWQYVQFDVLIPSGVTQLFFGFVIEAGQAWVDDVTLTSLAVSPRESAHQITAQGLANLTSFARLLGAVRHFHPSDQAVGVDWKQFAAQGVRVIEGAATPAEFAAALQNLFSPIAPTVRVFIGGSPPDLPAELHPSSTEGLNLVRWSNYGVGLGRSNIYSSERNTAPADGALPAEFVDPAQPYIADLGQGVAAMVPLTLYADRAGTLPHASYVLPAAEGLVVEDRATRLAGVILAWSVVQNFYPYFDVVDADWPAALRTALSAAATDAGASDYLVTLQRLVAAQKDGHGYAFQTSAPATYAVPLIWDWIEGRLIVTQVKQGQAQSIAPGDCVISIDGKPVADVIAAKKELVSGATPQWILSRVLSEIAVCNSQTMDVEIEPYASPGASRKVSFLCLADRSWTESRGEIVQQLDGGIVYVDLDRATSSDWTAALPRLSAATGIVLDMRGYPKTSIPLQHLSETPLESEQWHVPVPSKPDRVDLGFARASWTLAPLQPYLNARKVYLTDGRAVSYAETLMGIVEHYKLAEIVGSPTAGTNGNINYNDLPAGFRVSFTGMKVLKHDGSRYHGVGVHPTVPAGRTQAGVARGLDEVLLRGIEVVKWPLPGAAPAITAEGIVNAASFTGGPVAPGEIVSLFGSGLSSAKTANVGYDLSGYLPLSSGDAKVFFDGIQAPLVFVSDGQINAIVPYGVSGSGTKVRVEVQGRVSGEATLPVAAAAPGIFGGITNQDGGVNSEAMPAARGEVVTLYATGIGRTVPAGVDGMLPAPGKWPVPAGNLTVSFGGVPGAVLFQGQTFAGVLQVNVRVPDAAPLGSKIPVALAVNGISSHPGRTVTIK
jgi:uncharacterized protein (TIGR03437 family)